jgi:hypothetical protein
VDEQEGDDATEAAERQPVGGARETSGSSHARNIGEALGGGDDVLDVSASARRREDGGAGLGRAPQRGPGAAETGGYQREVAPPPSIVVRARAKALKIAKFKGLDDAMPVTMWLQTVRAEVRRQAVTMGVQWRDDQLYHEVAAHLEGEAQRWFATVMESVERATRTSEPWRRC